MMTNQGFITTMMSGWRNWRCTNLYRSIAITWAKAMRLLKCKGKS